MKKVQILFLAAFALIGTAAMAQQDFSSPQYARWGDTPEAREANITASNFLAEAIKSRNYNEAAVHLKHLLDNRPEASVNTYKYGRVIYGSKINSSQTREQRNMFVDSLLLMYDLQAQYFGEGGKESRSDILGEKAKATLLYRSGDREDIRNSFKEAIAAGGEATKSECIALYMVNLCDDYRNGEVVADEVLAEYDRLSGLLANNPAATECQMQVDAAFGQSGVANCENLERIYRAKLESNPNDEATLSQAVSLMTRAKCNSPYYMQILERYYTMKPSSETAMALAQIFQNENDYAKAVKYLNEALNVEKDPAEREKLLVRIGVVELVANRTGSAVTAVRQALDLNPENGLAYFVLAQCYASSAASCSGMAGQATYWAAYDTMSKALNFMSTEDEATYGSSAKSSLAAYRSRFPTSEECFFNELKEGDRYTVSCGTASGVVTTVRGR